MPYCLPICDDIVQDPCLEFSAQGTNDTTFETTNCTVEFDLLSFTLGYSTSATITRIPCGIGTEAIGTLTPTGSTTYTYRAFPGESGQTVCLSFHLTENGCEDTVTIVLEFGDLCESHGVQSLIHI